MGNIIWFVCLVFILEYYVGFGNDDGCYYEFDIGCFYWYYCFFYFGLIK